MTATDRHRDALAATDDWDSYLTAHSGLPGPRASIELARAAAAAAPPERIRAWLEHDAGRAPTNDPAEFLAFCGVLGLGRLFVEGDEGALTELLGHAGDERWRVREAVAMALQWIGRADFERLITEMRRWAGGTRLQQRAAAAALCEPGLLSEPGRAARVLEVLDAITASIAGEPNRSGDDFAILRKGMGYCWSVAVAAEPASGKPVMERWINLDDPDVRWIMRQNLGKRRMHRMDPAWVERLLEETATGRAPTRRSGPR